MDEPLTDQKHLQLLALFHFLVGGLTVLFGCIPLIHLSIGIAIIFFPDALGGRSSNQPPVLFGWLFALMGALFFACAQALAVCMILAGRFINRRGRYLFVFIVACIECALMPFGTVLGVLTIVVLSRESVKRLFSAATVPAPPTD